MSQTVIKVENLGKLYRLGEVGTGTISHDLNRWWARVRGKEDPFAKIGQVNDRTTKGSSDYVWALKDVNFEVKQGEVLGIIGRNGAGKSTLLKILSKVTAPTTGSIKVKGRIASLLEVGTGFHPELTGRENIYLNGAILGMTRNEIRSKFDEIVDFAGVERYIDTPVKRYSSGMYVRLAFAVAAFLEPEILIVDEVLAVGDAEFQKKCLGRMKDVSVNEGRTVLFVSHNMGAVKNLCSQGIWIHKGSIEAKGVIDNVIHQYHEGVTFSIDRIGLVENRTGNGRAIFDDFTIADRQGQHCKAVFSGDEIVFEFKIKVFAPCKNVSVGFSLHDESDDMLTVLYSDYQNSVYDLSTGMHTIRFRYPNNNLSPGRYYVRGLLLDNGVEADWPREPLGAINVVPGNFYETNHLGFTNSRIKFLIKGIWD